MRKTVRIIAGFRVEIESGTIVPHFRAEVFDDRAKGEVLPTRVVMEPDIECRAHRGLLRDLLIEHASVDAHRHAIGQCTGKRCSDDGERR